MSARSSPSRRAACRACSSWLQRSRLIPAQILCGTVERPYMPCSIGNVVAQLSWGEDKLVSPQKRHALLTERYPLPRCSKRGSRRAPRRRRQPSSGWPRWTRRAARRGRPPCARPWRWAYGGCGHTLAAAQGPQAQGHTLHSGRRSKPPCPVVAVHVHPRITRCAKGQSKEQSARRGS